MKLGSNDISSVKIGSTDVNKIYIGSTEVWTSFTGLLDTYSGAAAAYSLRLLSSTYTGNAIQVRRASDNATQDIGFVDGQLDTTTLETFCSGTDGFVTTWYDQSGNGYDATQSTSANQPQIVSSGSTILENSKPCVQFDGNDDYLIFNGSTITALTEISMFSIQKNIVSGVKHFFTMGIGSSGKQIGLGYINKKLYTFLWSLSEISSSSMWLNEVISTSITLSGISQNLYINSTNNTNTIASIYGITDNIIRIGASSVGLYTPMLGKEFILYPSDQSSNRTGIESNINNHYNIY